MVKEVDDKGACCIGKKIPVLLIPSVQPSHRLVLVVILVSLRGLVVCDNGMPTDEVPWAKTNTDYKERALSHRG